MWLWLGILFLLDFIKGAALLSLLEIKVPDIAASGQSIRLSCTYSLDGAQLYSIKWYKDRMEFFRYVPRDRPPAQFFPLEGLDIDLDKSLNGTVFIKDLALSSSGIYRCEIWADYPTFHKIEAEKQMSVQEIISNKSERLFCPMALLLTVFALRLCI